MARTVNVDKTEKVADDDKSIVVVVTEAVETRHTLRQARQERDMAKMMFEQAKAQLDQAQGKVDETKKALA